jgi:hypothetical protein
MMMLGHYGYWGAATLKFVVEEEFSKVQADTTSSHGKRVCALYSAIMPSEDALESFSLDS